MSIIERKPSNDIDCHLEQLKSDLLRFQISNNRNFILCKSIDVLVEKADLIKRLVERNPRFNWNFIQDEIDRLYKKDTSLTGVIIMLDYKDFKTPNRASIKVNLTKNNGYGV